MRSKPVRCSSACRSGRRRHRVTLRFDVSEWFLNATGDALVDPATANAAEPNEALVRGNIQRSINAFKDDDHDGHDNESQGDDGDDQGGGQGDG